MGHTSRKPTSNELPPRSKEGKGPWLGENALLDETALLLAGSAERCAICKRATHIRYLNSDKRCPDCR